MIEKKKCDLFGRNIFKLHFNPQSFSIWCKESDIESKENFKGSSNLELYQKKKKTELQTSNQRFPILDSSSNPVAVFSAGESHDCIVHYTLKESGIHM